MGQSERQTWVLQVCPVCGWTILDDQGVRNVDDESVGQDCEAWLLDSEIDEHGPCRVVTVAEIGELWDDCNCEHRTGAIFRSGSGHRPSCPVHQRWLETTSVGATFGAHYFEGRVPGQYASVNKHRTRDGEVTWRWLVSGERGGESGECSSEPDARHEMEDAKRRLWA